ncbi:MAG: P44/Msp2 family outer membrane protein [Erythrobacter sp.]
MNINSKLRLIAAGTVAMVALPTAAYAQQGPYVGISAGVSLPGDSKNQGEFNSTVPATDDFGAIPGGTALAWDTNFDTGFAVNGQVGYAFDNGFRLELEGVFSRYNVADHSGLLAGGANIDGVDVAVLTRGPADVNNPTVGAVIADGQGRVTNYGLFANVFYDIETGTAFKPYVGAGAGVQWVDVDFRPSGVDVGSGVQAGIAYQLMAGASYEITPKVDLFGQYTYRANGNRADIDLDLLPATLGVQNHQSLITAGVRVKFGS